MHLVVKQGDRTIEEYQFASGPIYIGRHDHSQIFLPDRMVSRQHAVIFATRDGKWMVEDLDSANKTYLNDKEIQKAGIKTGDCIRIADFNIEISLEEDTAFKEPIHLEDTLTTAERDLQIIVRRPDFEHAPDITLPAKRAKDFLQATEAICKADSHDVLLQTLLSTAARQFSAYHTWAALRSQPSGPMLCHAGRARDGKAIQLSEITLNEKITQAVEKKQFLLLPRLSTQMQEQGIRSIMIAPIVGPAGAFGVLYIDNGMDHESYSLSDLDYSMLLAIHTAAIVKNF